MATPTPPEPESLDRITARLPDDVVLRTFDAETVLLNLTTGTYHGLNGTAGRMLEALRDSPDAGAAAVAVAAEVDQPVERIRVDLARLCGDLLERGLLEIDHAQG